MGSDVPDIRPAKQKADTLADLRASVLNGILYTMVPLGAMVTAAGIYQELHTTHHMSLVGVYVFGYLAFVAVAFAKRLPYTVRQTAFLLVMYAMGFSELWFFGLSSIAILFLFPFVVFAGLLGGLRVGILAFCLSVISIAAVASLAIPGVIAQNTVYLQQVSDTFTWIALSLPFVMMSAMVLVSLTLILRSLDRNMRSAQTLVSELQTQIHERARAQETLRHNEERFRSLIENASDGVILSDARGVVQYASPATERLLGYPPGSLVGRGVFEFVHPEDMSVATEGLRRAVEDRPSSATTVMCRIRHNDGSWRTAECVGKDFEDPEGKHWVIINFRDLTERRKMEDTLRASEERYRVLVETTATGFVTVDTDGRVLDANAEYVRLTGFQSLDEIKGRCVTEWTSPDDIDRNAREIQQCLAVGSTRNLEIRYVDPSGNETPVEVNASCIETNQGRVILSLCRDITIRKQAEEVLRLDELRAEALLKLHHMSHASDQEITSFALEEAIQLTRSEVGYLAFTNEDESVLTMYSWSRTAMEECRITEKPIEYPVASTGLWGEAIRQRKPIITNDYQAPNPLKKGYPEGHVHVTRHMNVPVFDGDKIVLVAGVGNKKSDYDEQDVRQLTLLMQGMWRVVQRRRMEQTLRESERRFRELLETVSLVAVMLDADGRIMFCNKFLLDLTEYAAGDVIGKDWFEVFLPPQERNERRADFLKWLAGTDPIVHHEYSILTRSGDPRLISWDRTRLRDADGNIMGIASLGRDITEHRALEEQYRQAQKMEAVGHLAGGIAHDFNNLLQVITGCTDLVLSDLPEDSPIRAELSQTLQAAERATGLVRQLLTFSRRETMRPQVLDLDRVITNMAKMLRRLIGEHIELQLTTRSTLWPVWADPGHIEQILMNLCVNARDALPNGGMIHIEIENTRVDRRYCETHAWAKEGDYVLLTVTDTGIGMSPEVQQHIFEPFFTTKEVGKGSGLGLATVYGIMKQHEGLIHVYSEIDRGTVFRLYFPATVQRTAEDAPKKPEKPAAGGSETILVAEDDELVRSLATRILSNAGYRVLAARDGQEALDVFHEHADEISLCLLDVVMPRKNGRAVYDAIVRRKPHAVFLFSSGYSYNVLETSGLPEGADLIQKPYSPAALARKVRELLDNKR